VSTPRSLSCLFDTDVLLDVVFRREPFANASAHVLLLAERRTIAGWTTPLILANVFYLVGRARDVPAAHDAIRGLRGVLGILGVGTAETDAAFARAADYPDWEDQLQYAAAESHFCEYLITRNVSDFPTSPVRAVTPSEFLAVVVEQDS
jgi:predicted nucleic acid-binding protein